MWAIINNSILSNISIATCFECDEHEYLFCQSLLIFTVDLKLSGSDLFHILIKIVVIALIAIQ